jgi:hypothetical protein
MLTYHDLLMYTDAETLNNYSKGAAKLSYLSWPGSAKRDATRSIKNSNFCTT